MPTPASSQRNSERTAGVRSIAKEIEGFIRPWLYVVHLGNANARMVLNAFNSSLSCAKAGRDKTANMVTSRIKRIPQVHSDRKH